MPKTREVYVSVTDENDLRVGGTFVTMSEQCLTCKHKGRNLSCAAFPDVIPNEILNGGHDHRLPFPGDGGVRYELHPRVIPPKKTETNQPSRTKVRALRTERRRIRKQIEAKLGKET